jgi:hypothetical protein
MSYYFYILMTICFHCSLLLRRVHEIKRMYLVPRTMVYLCIT